MREILDDLMRTLEAGGDVAFCSVVETKGSTPQKAGAIMVVRADGGQLGTLGGGCVEAETRQRALRQLEGTEPTLLTFTLDDDYGWDDGLICGGRMTFVIQPVRGDRTESGWKNAAADYFHRFTQLVARGQGCFEAIALDAVQTGLAAGTRFLFDHTGALAGALGADDCPAVVAAGLPDLSVRPAPRSLGGVAYLPVLPRCRLVIVGAGHVGQAVGRLARDVDFDVWVVDDREKYASAERFPFAERRIVGDMRQVLRALETDENCYCLVVTRGHAHDQEALHELVKKPSRYLGMIGSRRKIRLILGDLARGGVPPERLAQVYAPLGIDIGSQTVPEIAVSIVAQLVGHRNRGPAAFPPPDHGLERASPTLAGQRDEPEP